MHERLVERSTTSGLVFVAVEARGRTLEVDDVGLPVEDLEQLRVHGLLAHELDRGRIEEVVEDELDARVDDQRRDLAPLVSPARGVEGVVGLDAGDDLLDEILALGDLAGTVLTLAGRAEELDDLAGIVDASDALQDQVIGVTDAAIGVADARAQRAGQACEAEQRGQAPAPWHATTSHLGGGRGRRTLRSEIEGVVRTHGGGSLTSDSSLIG
jgi:hypothetical protein